MLDEATFQNQIAAGPERWVLADGRSLAGQGTAYEKLLQQASIPDLRGVFVRGKNNGRNDGYQNLDGDLALGQLSKDKFKAHSHGGSTANDTPDHVHHFGGYPFGVDYGGSNTTQNLGVKPNGFDQNTDGANTRHTHSIAMDGDNETAPKSVTLNAFIRID